MIFCPVNSILADPNLNLREGGIDSEYVAELAEFLEDKDFHFPPISIIGDGDTLFLWDGFHRLEAYKSAGRSEVPTEQTKGTRRDAILASAGANAEHGKRRTSIGRRKAVLVLLNDPEWVHWSDREIAKRCGCSNQVVGRLRLTDEKFKSDSRTFTQKFHGKVEKKAQWSSKKVYYYTIETAYIVSKCCGYGEEKKVVETRSFAKERDAEQYVRDVNKQKAS